MNFGITEFIVIAVVFFIIIIIFAVGRSIMSRGKKKTKSPASRLQTINQGAKSTAGSRAASSKTSGSLGENRIFLSYRREDSADVTGRIYDRLIEHFGEDAIFKDVDSIPLGVDFRDHLDRMVGKCVVLITVIGKQWLLRVDTDGNRRIDEPKDFVRIEIESALKRNIPIIPVLVQGTSMPPETELPPGLKPLAYRNGTLVRPDPDFHKDVDRLIAGLETHLKNPP